MNNPEHNHQHHLINPDGSEFKDPVCGMTVTPPAKGHVLHAGHDYYFCSEKCLHEFEADPSQYDGTTPHTIQPVVEGAIYTCPMHPEIRQNGPGVCPKCGMALEPELPSLDDEENPELKDFKLRFWWTLPLTIVVTVLAMFGHKLGLMSMATQTWVEFVLSVPITLWAGWPFFERGFQSVINRSPNMWTLIGLGTGAAFLYSVVATFAPQVFPESFFEVGLS